MCIPNVTIQRQSLLMVSYISLRLSMHITNTHTQNMCMCILFPIKKKCYKLFYIFLRDYMYLRDYSILLQRYLPHKKNFFFFIKSTEQNIFRAEGKLLLRKAQYILWDYCNKKKLKETFIYSFLDLLIHCDSNIYQLWGTYWVLGV